MDITFERVHYKDLNSRQQEAYNFQKVSGVLADFGFVTIRHNRPIGAHFHSGGAKFPYLGEDLYEAFG